MRSKHTKLRRFICLALAAIIISANAPNLHHATTAKSCDDVQFIFARGSGSSLNADDARAWQSNIQQVLNNSQLSYSFYELGTSNHGGAQYPAIGIGNDSPLGIFTAAGALVSAGESYRFGASVQQGINELKNYLAEVTNTCPQTKFVLGGYSQGAIVISQALPQLDANQIIYAATFGDPKLYLPEGQGRDPAACHNQNLSNYRANVPDCYTDEGILQGLQPYQPNNYLDKLGAWCNNQDLMCGSSWDLHNLLGAHLGYISQNRYSEAANVIAQKLTATHPTQIPKTSTHDLAILIDTTGSMSSLIDTYRAEALRLARKTIAKGGRVALYQYRDLGDPYTPNQILNFTSVISEFEDALSSLTTDNGGDDEESALNALLHTMNTLNWQLGATKSIVLLTDAGYHLTDHDGTTLADVVKRSREIDPVNIYTLTPAEISTLYNDLATQTDGRTFTTDEELELSTNYISDHTDLVISEPESTPATITNLQINSTTNSAQINFTPSANTAATLLILNDTPLGFVNSGFTITDLQAQNTLTLIPISNNGRKGASVHQTFYAGLKIPDCGFKQNQL